MTDLKAPLTRIATAAPPLGGCGRSPDRWQRGSEVRLCMAADFQFGKQMAHTAFDFVADRAHGVDVLAGGVV